MTRQPMKIRTMVATLLLPVAFASAADPLADNFRTPPPETRPWCYWYWISDNLSREGITKDAPLLPAGLLGPVSLQAGRVAILEGKL